MFVTIYRGEQEIEVRGRLIQEWDVNAFDFDIEAITPPDIELSEAELDEVYKKACEQYEDDTGWY